MLSRHLHLILTLLIAAALPNLLACAQDSTTPSDDLSGDASADTADVSTPDTDRADIPPDDTATPDTDRVEDTSSPDPDAEPDDAATDANDADAQPIDAEPDALDDAEPDALADAEPDALPDALPDAEPDAPPTAFCDPSIGATRPLEPCSAAHPCTNVSNGNPLTSGTDVPTCRTTVSDRPSYNDGDPVAVAINGADRYLCYHGSTASAGNRRPLLIFLHGAHGAAGNVYNSTSVRAEVAARDWTFVSVQGRNLHWVNTADGAHFDHFHRDLASPSTNQDVALLDQLIDTAVNDFFVDPRRIYLMGWSNGGFMAQMYGIARHDTPTPGGNRVAAVAAFTAADPFHTTTDDASPSCRLATYPTTTLPIFLVSRACDIVACDEAQKADLVAEGFPVAPGHVVESWVSDLRGRMADPNVQWRPILGSGQPAVRCTGAALCGPATATLNHLSWPDGVADGSGINHEADLFDFLSVRLRP